MSSIIPKIIHQTAPADKTKWHKIWFTCQQSWKDKFPDYEYKMWTDEDLDTFMKTNYPDDYEIYINYPENIMRIDMARYYILNTYGGIYADMDYECIRNFEEFIVPDKVSIAESSNPDKSWETFQNALMISPIGHPLWKNVIFRDIRLNKDVRDVKDTRSLENFYLSFRDSLVLALTGPQLIMRAYQIAPIFINPLPSKQFSVMTVGVGPSNSDDIIFNDYDNISIYAVHHGTCTWC